MNAELARDDALLQKTVPHYGKMNAGQQDVLLSAAYNLGPGTLSRGALGRDLQSGNFQQFGLDLPNYNTAGGQVNAGLTNRRNAESALWNQASGFAPVTPAKDGTAAGTDPISAWLQANPAQSAGQDGSAPQWGSYQPAPTDRIGALIQNLSGGSSLAPQSTMQGNIAGGVSVGQLQQPAPVPNSLADAQQLFAPVKPGG